MRSAGLALLGLTVVALPTACGNRAVGADQGVVQDSEHKVARDAAPWKKDASPRPPPPPPPPRKDTGPPPPPPPPVKDAGPPPPPPGAGIGAVCSASQPCKAGLYCLHELFYGPGGKGYCTKTCASPPTDCTGAPAGTKYYCGLQMGQTMYCLFICAFASSRPSYPCPPALTCTPLSTPTATIYLCTP